MDIEQEVVDCVNDLVNKVYQKERCRIYYEKNKESQKEYYQKNKESQKEYYEKNKDKISRREKEYRQTPNGIKSKRISQWKHKGIITDDYDQLYNHYLKTAYCDACKVELTYDRLTTATTKCCDHDHRITDRPNFRNILCHPCNIKRR
tara:strand:+ start:343 stop:786 length:444 start_codon:yes stop_codon:yes gene_type:complete